jgi:hypothetical protein
MNWDDENFTCSVCNTDRICLPSGPEKSPILIIGGYPEPDEIRYSKPFSGSNGSILMKELSYLGVDVKQCRLTNLWLHEPNDNAGCLVIGGQAAIKEAKGKKAVLLVGSDVVKYFTQHSVMDVCGLRVKSNFISAPIIMACVSPNDVFRSGLGEFRLALTKFSVAIEGII